MPASQGSGNLAKFVPLAHDDNENEDRKGKGKGGNPV